MKLWITVLAAIGLLGTLPAMGQTFHGYTCTQDCSGHEAGYEWAEDRGITDPDDCGGRSNSFIEGCQAYAEQFQNYESEDSSWGEDEDEYGYGDEEEEDEDEDEDEEGYWEDSDEDDWR